MSTSNPLETASFTASTSSTKMIKDISNIKVYLYLTSNLILTYLFFFFCLYIMNKKFRRFTILLLGWIAWLISSLLVAFIKVLIGMYHTVCLGIDLWCFIMTHLCHKIVKSIRQLHPKKDHLWNRLECAKDYDEWFQIAIEIDKMTGNDQWKHITESNDYDYQSLTEHMELMKKFRQSNDNAALFNMIKLCIHRDFCNVHNQELYRYSLTGTKYCIDEFFEEVILSLDHITNYFIPIVTSNGLNSMNRSIMATNKVASSIINDTSLPNNILNAQSAHCFPSAIHEEPSISSALEGNIQHPITTKMAPLCSTMIAEKNVAAQKPLCCNTNVSSQETNPSTIKDYEGGHLQEEDDTRKKDIFEELMSNNEDKKMQCLCNDNTPNKTSLLVSKEYQPIMEQSYPSITSLASSYEISSPAAEPLFRSQGDLQAVSPQTSLPNESCESVGSLLPFPSSCQIKLSKSVTESDLLLKSSPQRYSVANNENIPSEIKLERDSNNSLAMLPTTLQLRCRTRGLCHNEMSCNIQGENSWIHSSIKDEQLLGYNCNTTFSKHINNTNRRRIAETSLKEEKCHFESKGTQTDNIVYDPSLFDLLLSNKCNKYNSSRLLVKNSRENISKSIFNQNEDCSADKVKTTNIPNDYLILNKDYFQIRKIVYHTDEGFFPPLKYNFEEKNDTHLYSCAEETTSMHSTATSDCNKEGNPIFSVDQNSVAVLNSYYALRMTVGKTALCLSGGGSLAMYHFGVIKVLIQEGLLPKIISGASGGAIVAAILAIHTDKEILQQVVQPDVSTKLNVPWFPPLLEQLKNFAIKGRLMDPQFFQNSCRTYFTNWTFEEAFKKTGRCINIVVSPASRQGEALILNHIATPHVYLWSAVCASCSLPGLLPPVELYAKDPVTNECISFFPTGALLWMDGSIKKDLPFSELSSLFNVKQFLVSQVNPHHAPFVSSHGELPIKRNIESWLTQDIKNRYSKLARYSMVPKIYGQEIATFWLVQGIEGNLTIAPRANLLDWCRVICHPTTEDMHHYINCGMRRTFEFIPRIKRIMCIERKLKEMTSVLERLTLNQHICNKCSFGISIECDPNTDQRNMESSIHKNCGEKFHRFNSYLLDKSTRLQWSGNSAGKVFPYKKN